MRVFAAITYSKGGSCIRMIANYVDAAKGAGTFNRGLTYYLTEHAYGNANPTDLWRAQQIVLSCLRMGWGRTVVGTGLCSLRCFGGRGEGKIGVGN